MKTYTYEEVLKASIAYFGGDELAAEVFASKYALRDLDGQIYELTPADMHKRLAKEFARIESKYENPMTVNEIYSLLADVGNLTTEEINSMTLDELAENNVGFGPVVAQGSPMSAIGNPFQYQSLSNCFAVASPHDSYGGIMRTDEELVEIMKRRGGAGVNISTIRPKGLKTANAARTTDGIGVFIERYSNTCREVAQGGRRGALMTSIDCRYPELETFINIKRDLKKATGTNLSIMMHDDFMRAVKDNGEYVQQFPVDSSEPIMKRTVNARQLWKTFVDAAWSMGEPAPLFWDTITRRCPADIYKEKGFASVTTNPCVTGDTVVHTSTGDKTVKELADEHKQFIVRSYDITSKRVEEKRAVAFKTKENADLLQIVTKSGKKIRLTPDHRVYTQRGWIEARSLTKSDRITCLISECQTEWDEIVDISPVDNEDVYDLSVDDHHNFFANDLLVHNCSELTLSAYDSCRLMLLNLAKFVVNPFLPHARFDYEKFDRFVQKAQRLMDDLVDLELEAVTKIIEKIESDKEPDDIKRVELHLWEQVKHMCATGRRTGLGVTAVADVFAYVGLQYCSDASIEMAESIARALCLGAYRSSVQMAAERGPFPAFDLSLERGHEFLEQVFAEDERLRARYEQFGRRNIALTMISPAGTVSLETQTSAGIDPVFKFVYDRRKKINNNDPTMTADFIDDMGDRWKTFTVVHPGVQKWMFVNGMHIAELKTSNTEEILEKSPYHLSASHQVNHKKKVELQAAMQKWICHSISTTVNLPIEATRDDVDEIYMYAWEKGCKGVTVYRDGSRAGVLVSAGSKSATTKSTGDVIERPKKLKCDIHRVSVKGESYLVIVGLNDGVPYELFAGKSEYVEVPKKIKSGTLVKSVKKDGLSTYNMVIPVDDGDANGDNFIFKDIVTLFDNPLYGAFTRTISLALRHGVPLQFLVEQLRKDKYSDIMSFSSVIARVLAKNYIPDGTKLSKGSQCPKCGSTNMVYSGGCAYCSDCLDTKCQ